MATRKQYRDQLEDKIVGLEDEGYGDFSYEVPELNTYLELALARLYPAVYKKVATAVLTPVGYGNNRLGSAAVTLAERVFLVEDATESSLVYGWTTRPGKIVGLNVDNNPTVIAYYYDAYTLPANDTEDVGVPAMFSPLVVLGALIEALESRHDTGQRPDPPAGHHETTLVDRLQRRYEAARDDLAMGLPALVV